MITGQRPILAVCPICAPGPYAFAGKIIAKVCKKCRELLKEDA